MHRICVNKVTGALIESQSGGDDNPSLMALRLDTLRQNAIRAGYAESDIEVSWTESVPEPPFDVAGSIGSLWQAAHDYEYASINGSAIGIVTIGVLQGKPKCLACTAWMQSVWQQYYLRKPQVGITPQSELLDFSICGEMPHSVPELMAEVGMA